MAENITSGIVIDQIRRVGDVGEPGYSAYGQRLPKCTSSGSRDSWHGATQDDLIYALPTTCYITEKVYSYLTQDEIESIVNAVKGVVPTDYSHTYKVCPPGDRCHYCRAFKSDMVPRPLYPLDPCSAVICEPKCFGTDTYSTVCRNGICVKDGMLKGDDPVCGYQEPCPDEPITVNDPATSWMLLGVIIIIAMFLYKR